jgi:hypothetical protein
LQEKFSEEVGKWWKQQFVALVWNERVNNRSMNACGRARHWEDASFFDSSNWAAAAA